MKKQFTSGADMPYPGSGKLTERGKYDKGSWMMDQMSKGYKKCDRGIAVDDSEKGFKRFAMVASNITSDAIRTASCAECSSIDFPKAYKVLETAGPQGETQIVLRWCVCGDLDGSTVEDIDAVSAFLANRVFSECNRLTGNDDAFIAKNYNGAYVDFGHSCIKFDVVGYVNPVVGIDALKERIESCGFVSAD